MSLALTAAEAALLGDDAHGTVLSPASTHTGQSVASILSQAGFSIPQTQIRATSYGVNQAQVEDEKQRNMASKQSGQAVAAPSSPRPQLNAVCDRCNTRIDGIRYKCQHCPDFDYCTNCVGLASSIHPGHDFAPLQGSRPLSGEELVQHVQPTGDKILDPTAFRLLGKDSRLPVARCLSCQPVTGPLPAIGIILQDEELRRTGKKGLQLRWPARISSLVEATVGGCAFCSLVLHKFFGPGNGIMFTYEPQTPWMCQTDNERRQDVVAHAMHLLTLMKSDEFIFVLEPVRRKGFADSDFHRLRIELYEAKQGREVLDKALASRGQQYVELDVYAAEDNPAAALISSRPPNPSPASQKALDQVKSWLTRCEQKHGEACAARHSRLPTRVIDVSNTNGLRLLETSSDDIGRYVALSYCWGGTQEFRTTKKTSRDKLNGFALSDLPQTLQDAVTVTRALDIDYLWVDSICIFQDDPNDKAHEISHMADTYKHATLTISASKADGASKGFLRDEANTETGLWKNLIPLAFPMPNPAANSIKDAFEMPRQVFGTIWLCDEDPNMSATFRSPVDRRGWCLQERLLSSRLVSYGRWPTWKCGLGAYSDGGFYPQIPQNGRDERQLSKCLFEHRQHTPGGQTDLHTSNQLLQSWYKLINEYTQRELGLRSDRLPAIGGIAAEISRVTGIPYLAGLWQTNLLHDLTWFAKAKEWLTRPEDYHGPTWSWAAVDCPVSYDEITEDSFEIAHVLQCQVDASPSEAFGEVRGGRLEIEGPFAQIDKEDVIALLQDQSMAQPPPRSNDVQEWYRQILEFVNNESKGNRLAEEKWADQLPDEVFAIITFSRDWRITHEERVEGIFYSGLLLRKVDGGYERIAAFMNEDLKWMDQTMALWERKTIVLL
jgi:hypothetical protein